MPPAARVGRAGPLTYLAAGRAPADADQEGLAAVGLLVVLQGLLAVPGHDSRRPSSRSLCEATHAPRPRLGSLSASQPRSRLGPALAGARDRGGCWWGWGGRDGFPGGAESSAVSVAARGVYIPGRGQRDEAAPIRAGCALLFARSLGPSLRPARAPPPPEVSGKGVSATPLPTLPINPFLDGAGGRGNRPGQRFHASYFKRDHKREAAAGQI